MPRFTVHAVAVDRPGIVAGVTQALADVGCNLEESRMTLLHGQFSIVVVLDAPELAHGTVIEEVLSPLLEEYALNLLVRPVRELPEDHATSSNLVAISVEGADHPGTISRISRAITDAKGNIVDLVGHVVLEGSVVPSHLEITTAIEPDSVPALRAALERTAEELAVHCRVREGASRAN